MFRKIVFGVFALALGCAADSGPFSALESKGERKSHPLQNRIYIPAENRFISEAELLNRIKKADVVYLGEKHDNPEHHRLQAHVYRKLIESGAKPAVVFEMFERDVNAKLSAHLQNPGADLSEVPKIVEWKRMGWPDWSMYAPLVEIAHRSRLPVLGADLSSSLSRKVGRQGLGALPPDVAKELSLGPPEKRHKSLVLEDLYVSHCKFVPREKLSSLYDAWRARNRAMALSILQAVPLSSQRAANSALMITGSGHVDREVGIPPHLSKLRPGLKQVSLAFTEVNPGETQPSRYMSRSGAFDVLWFTKRPQREDPCVQFKKSLEKMRSRHKN